MIAIALAVLPVFLLLVTTEYLWRTNRLRGESARKLIHIVVGSYVAFWPFFISFEMIQLISAAFLLVVAVSLKLNIFRAIHGVARQTWGEVLFAVGIGLVAVLTDEPWIFAACILHLSVADGLAALTGLKWGKKTTYTINGYKKSLIGTGVFWLCSLVITAVAIYHLPYLQLESRNLLLWLPLTTAFTENIGFGGTDNVLVPLIVYLGLTAY
jgi:phytol kinase